VSDLNTSSTKEKAWFWIRFACINYTTVVTALMFGFPHDIMNTLAGYIACHLNLVILGGYLFGCAVWGFKFKFMFCFALLTFALLVELMTAVEQEIREIMILYFFVLFIMAFIRFYLMSDMIEKTDVELSPRVRLLIYVLDTISIYLCLVCVPCLLYNMNPEENWATASSSSDEVTGSLSITGSSSNDEDSRLSPSELFREACYHTIITISRFWVFGVLAGNNGQFGNQSSIWTFKKKKLNPVEQLEAAKKAENIDVALCQRLLHWTKEYAKLTQAKEAASQANNFKLLKQLIAKIESFPKTIEEFEKLHEGSIHTQL